MNNTIERRHFTLTAAAASILFSAALAGCSPPAVAAAPDETAGPIAVTAVPASLSDVATAFESGGVVRARTTAAIASRLLAPVREVRVMPGDRVRTGQILIVLDGADLAAAARAARAAAIAAEQGRHAAVTELQSAEAALALARASYDRISSLQARRSATAQELDEATATLRSAEARVTGASARASQATSVVESARATSDQATTIASFTAVAAPFDGTVTEKLVEPGNMASPGTPLLRLEDTRGFRLEVRVDESRVGQIRHRDSVPVVLGNRTINGTVVEVSRAVDADARAFLVKIDLPDAPGLQSGQFGKARFAGTPRRALTVPSSSIVRRGQLTSVFVVDNGTARLRLVRVTGSEVVAGLAESELVIVSPPAWLTDGRRVRVGDR